jgi:hypothetical protein
MTVMTERAERFKNIAEGLQSITLVIAIVIGGIWTVILGAKEKAALDLAKERAEQERLANYGLDITVEAKQEQLTDNQGFYISALVKITNKGLHNRFINFTDEPPLQVSLVEFDKDGTSGLSNFDSYVQKNILADSIVLRTDTSASYPFLLRVHDKGLYMINFSVKLNKEEFKTHRDSGGPNDENVYWAGNTYVLVK